jgi:ABC-2 type transport system ATP-binding protein
MSAGRLVAQGTRAELRQAGEARIRVLTPDIGTASRVLAHLGLTVDGGAGTGGTAGRTGSGLDGGLLYAALPAGSGDGTAAIGAAVAPETVVAALVAAGVRVRGFATEQASLEERFVALTGEGFDVLQ